MERKGGSKGDGAMPLAESARVEPVRDRRAWKWRLGVGTGLIVFALELLAAVFHFWIWGRRLDVVVSTEWFGMLIFGLLVAHAVHLPFVAPLGMFWYGVTRAQVGLARFGYAMLLPAAIVTAYFSPTFSAFPGWIELVRGVIYLTGLLLLFSVIPRKPRKCAGAE